MANLYDLISDEKYANEEAEKFADLVEQDTTMPDDMNTGLKTPEDLIACFKHAGTQSPEAYEKFCSIGRQDN